VFSESRKSYPERFGEYLAFHDSLFLTKKEFKAISEFEVQPVFIDIDTVLSPSYVYDDHIWAFEHPDIGVFASLMFSLFKAGVPVYSPSTEGIWINRKAKMIYTGEIIEKIDSDLWQADSLG
jgi:hypothetical protein